MVEVYIKGKKLTGFNRHIIVLNRNSVASVFSLAGLAEFLPSPLEFAHTRINYKGSTLLTGKTIPGVRTLQSTPTETIVQGYSLPGVLERVNLPIEMYPLQFDNFSLRDVLDHVLAYFKLEYVAQKGTDTALDKRYKKITTEPGRTVKDFLNRLASQRGLILTHNAEGKLVLETKVESTAVPVRLSGAISSTLRVQGQNLHSEITVLRQASEDNPDGAEYTVKNPYVSKPLPRTKILTDGDLFDVQAAAENELRAELTKIKLEVLHTEYYALGTVFNYIVEGLPIKEWFVETVRIEGTAQEDNYTYTCVPNEAYT